MYACFFPGNEYENADASTDGRVAPRSGLASKNFIDTGAGVIDADYRGEVKVLLFNFSDVDFTGMTGLSSAYISPGTSANKICL
jgi:hypothetical protein